MKFQPLTALILCLSMASFAKAQNETLSSYASFTGTTINICNIDTCVTTATSKVLIFHMFKLTEEQEESIVPETVVSSYFLGNEVEFNLYRDPNFKTGDKQANIITDAPLESGPGKLYAKLTWGNGVFKLLALIDVSHSTPSANDKKYLQTASCSTVVAPTFENRFQSVAYHAIKGNNAYSKQEINDGRAREQTWFGRKTGSRINLP